MALIDISRCTRGFNLVVRLTGPRDTSIGCSGKEIISTVIVVLGELLLLVILHIHLLRLGIISSLIMAILLTWQMVA